MRIHILANGGPKSPPRCQSLHGRSGVNTAIVQRDLHRERHRATRLRAEEEDVYEIAFVAQDSTDRVKGRQEIWMHETQYQYTRSLRGVLPLPQMCLAGNSGAHRAARATRTLRHAAIGRDVSLLSRARIVCDDALT